MFDVGSNYDITMIKGRGADQGERVYRACVCTEVVSGTLVKFQGPEGEIIVNTCSLRFVSAKPSA